MNQRILEICIDNVAGLDAAIAGGADRIELCAALALGGLTPPASLMRHAAKAPVPVQAMIRPRAGDFVFSAAEVDLMLAEIDDVHAAGLAGVVLGASLPDDTLDEATLRRLHDHAAQFGLSTTLHRAFDLAPDLEAALECAIRLGFDRVLTSGGALTVPAGLDRIAGLLKAAGGRISIMPGGGIGPDTIRAIATRLSVSEMHASAAAPVAGVSPRLREFEFDSAAPRQTSARIVRDLQRAWREGGDAR
jgi:copper homeostasis protein